MKEQLPGSSPRKSQTLRVNGIELYEKKYLADKSKITKNPDKPFDIHAPLPNTLKDLEIYLDNQRTALALLGNAVGGRDRISPEDAERGTLLGRNISRAEVEIEKLKKMN